MSTMIELASSLPIGKIYAAISAIMKEVEFIGKDRRNEKQQYKFRGIDDVYNALHSILAKHEVFTVPTVLEDQHEERISKNGGLNIYRVLKIQYRFFANDGSFFDAVVIGEGMDSGDKASNKAMAVAHKYALLQVFCIPTEEDKDPEVHSHELVPKPKQVQVNYAQEIFTLVQKLVKSDSTQVPCLLGKVNANLKHSGLLSIEKPVFESFKQILEQGETRIVQEVYEILKNYDDAGISIEGEKVSFE